MAGTDIRVTSTQSNERTLRPISLVDATQLQDPRADDSPQGSDIPPRRPTAKQPTSPTVRKNIANRKHWRWQNKRGSELCRVGCEANSIPGAVDDCDAYAVDAKLPSSETRTEQQVRGRRTSRRDPKENCNISTSKPIHEFDVLYENQRGWFLFGNPLYSQSSLLNFDPESWTTREGKDSAVNITNAQLPDPSWQWAWKSWYVDMSYDVDEDGWQYSFSFSRKFSWHGTHPWFHCFVRRRRWLRKRLKKGDRREKASSILETAHNLTADYFTIHTKRERSPGSILENNTLPGSERSRQNTREIEVQSEEIKDIPSLLQCLRLATIDREKIDSIKQFIETGGPELIYLPKHIPEIMGMFVFQASKRQLLDILRETTSSHCQEKNMGQSASLYKEGLLSAEEEVENQLKGSLNI